MSRDPRKQIIIATLVVILFYLLLLGRQGLARDIILGNGYAYASYGDLGGLRILNTEDPGEPVEVSSFETPGSARSLTLVGNVVFIADGKGGLRLVDVSNPSTPVEVGSLRPGSDIYDVAVVGNYAYLAAGEDGLLVVDISNPSRPFIAGEVQTPGLAQGVASVEFLASLDESTPGQSVALQNTFVYVADGRQGMQVIDVRQPIAPQMVASLDLSGESFDLVVAGNRALVATGRSGLRVIDISVPTQPVEIAAYDTPGEAQDVAIAGTYAIVADGNEGFSVIDILAAPGSGVADAYMTPGVAMGVAALESIVYVADGRQGLRVVDWSSPGSPAVITVLEVPGEATVLQLLGGMVRILTGQWGSVEAMVWRTLAAIALDFFLFLAVLLLWLAVYAQFVLPVRNLNERWKAIERLVAYFLGNRGPAIFVQDGEVRQRNREEQRRGRGVALLDTASAIVFRNAHAFTRVAGPGIVFTEPYEYPAGTVDLHVQIQGAGPTNGEDPFMPKIDSETAEDFEKRQRRRYQTSGLTRDGVEVVPSIGAAFLLKGEPNEGSTRFGYNPDSVWRAIAHEAVRPDADPESDEYMASWNWLPLRLAIDLWREYLRKFTLDELFTFSSAIRNGNDRTAFDVINEMVRLRLTRPEVPELDDEGSPVEGSLKHSKEYDILEERGIQMLGVGIRNLRFPDSVERQLVEQWRTTWMQRAEEESRNIERLNAEARLVGQDTAVKEFATASGQLLAMALQHLPEEHESLEGEQMGPNMPESLRLLLQGTLKLCIREPLLQSRMSNQMNNLLEIIEWIRKR